MNVHSQEESIHPLTTAFDETALSLHLSDVQPTTISIHNMQQDTTNVKTFEMLVNDITLKWKLNKMQDIAFHITVRQFGLILSEQLEKHKSIKPLHMSLKGPRGTRKTHILKALQSLMSEFGCAHRFHFLAPTRGAAALVDGQTIHKGLGLCVRHCNENISDQKDKELTYRLSTKKQEDLHLEWHHVDFLVIDEVSMVSAQLLAELDAALWCRWDNGLLWILPPDGSFDYGISWIGRGLCLIMKSWFLQSK